MIIYIRPHHLVCMQHFIGKGYSPEFTDNMADIINYLKLHADKKIIKVVNTEDSVCINCPNNGLGKCSKAVQHDKDYFIVLRIDTDRSYSWNDIKQLIDQYLDYNTFVNICSNCKWFHICKELFQKQK